MPESIKLLIDSGVDIFATTNDPTDKSVKQTALEVAAFFGKADNARAIVDHPKFDQVDRQLRQAILDKSLPIAAASSGISPDPEPDRSKLIEILLDKGADPNASKDGWTVMQIAAREFSLDRHNWNQEIRKIISALVSHGAKIDLFSAVATGDEEQVDRLLKQGRESANSRARWISSA